MIAIIITIKSVKTIGKTIAETININKSINFIVN